uniref:Uncharacterized protein n=1 Tax=Magallana gigas TaxID=29159 RepID=K1QLD8_MAGGI
MSQNCEKEKGIKGLIGDKYFAMNGTYIFPNLSDNVKISKLARQIKASISLICPHPSSASLHSKIG